MGETGVQIFKSPIGNILIQGTNKYITSVNFFDQEDEIHPSSIPLLRICANQLQEYFAGKRKKFTVPFQQVGTEFQQRVWSELSKIAFGHLVSYEVVAIKIKDKKLVRAIGNAVGKNDMAIIVPCHRVIGKSGDMTGYAGGLWRKQWLIEHEQYYLLNF
ncbi:MAG TPA: methylated-DNA--[protein]-cysteine S-methyltransferase [Bacteroidales bacterium]|nr:methylated-DNA--[protein]-cysteine S-methyltransferase [Bacteroidales bacterium]